MCEGYRERDEMLSKIHFFVISRFNDCFQGIIIIVFLQYGWTRYNDHGYNGHSYKDHGYTEFTVITNEYKSTFQVCDCFVM